MKILIDPGHGGKEKGAVGPTGLEEKTVNLRVAYFLKSFLEQNGFNAHLTRKNDETLTLTNRVNIAKKLSPCLFISIHHNSNAEYNQKVNRFEVYVPFPFKGPYVALGHKLAEIFMNERGQLPFGPLPARYTVLKAVPLSILVEPGYIINPDEEKKLRNEDYLKKEAELLYRGISYILKHGCNFNLKFKRQTKKEVVVSLNNIYVENIKLRIDNKEWEHFDIQEDNIHIKIPSSWKELLITGTTHYGIELFPFMHRNKEYRAAVSFSQRVKEFGNLKLVSLSFFDEIGTPMEQGAKVLLSTAQGEIIRSSKKTEPNGEIFVLLKTDSPESSIDVSLKGFEAITNVHSIENLHTDEIAGIVEDETGGIENTLIVGKSTYTVTDRLGVFKIHVEDDIAFRKRGYYPVTIKNIEPGRNHFIKLKPLFHGLARKKILLRPSANNTIHDELNKAFLDTFYEFLSLSGTFPTVATTPYPGWDNESFTVKKLLETSHDIAIKIISRYNELIFFYYYRDEDTLNILRRISSYFAKLGLPLPKIQESSEYFVIHPSGRRFIINIPEFSDTLNMSLYSYLIILGMEHYLDNEPFSFESFEVAGNYLIAESNLFKLPGIKNKFYVPTNLLSLKLFTEERKCIHSPDGNSEA